MLLDYIIEINTTILIMIPVSIYHITDLHKTKYKIIRKLVSTLNLLPVPYCQEYLVCDVS